MAIAGTLLGSLATKDTTLTLSLAGLTLATGDTLQVWCLSFSGVDGGQVFWNGNALSFRNLGGVGPLLECWELNNATGGTGQLDVTFTDPFAAEARVIAAIKITGAEAVPFDQTNLGTGSGTSPSSGATPSTSQADELATAAISTRGPSGDSAGTWSGGFGSLIRVGTTGGAGNSNLTLDVGSLNLTAVGTPTGAKTGISSRAWIARINTYKELVVVAGVDSPDFLPAYIRQRALQGRRRGRSLHRTVYLDPNILGYETFESSVCDGEPVEGYAFTQGGTFYRFTSADDAQTFFGNSYPTAEISHDGLEFTAEESSGNTVVRVPRANPVAQLFRLMLPTSPVFLTVYRKHRGDPETRVVWDGKVIACSFEGPDARLTCAPISQVFRKKVPSLVYQSQCNWILFGPGCELDKLLFKTSGTVASVDGATVTSAAAGTQVDGYFRGGWAELANGERRFIVEHVGTTLSLMNAFGAVAPLDTIDLYPGCDRTEAVCATKFNNLSRHLGFPRIPTRNPYNGGLT